jgi:hypothetical protein
MSQGRFAAIGVPTVTGATPIPRYPAAGAHQADPLGTEPPLGFAVDDMPGLENPTGGSSVSLPVEPGGAPSSVPPDDVAAPPPSPAERDDG